MSSGTKALVLGGAGALGQSLTKVLIASAWDVVTVDVAKRPSEGLFLKHIEISAAAAQEDKLATIEQAIPTACKFSAIYCVAGGFLMAKASDANFLETVDKLWKMNVESSVLGAALASRFLAEQGLLAMTGAYAALQGTPAMIGYGLTKAAVHHLVRSLSGSGSGLPNGAKVLAVLPQILDTPSNRAAMPASDFSDWTPLEELSTQLAEWGANPQALQSGALIQVVTAQGKTSYTNIHP